MKTVTMNLWGYTDVVNKIKEIKIRKEVEPSLVDPKTKRFWEERNGKKGITTLRKTVFGNWKEVSFTYIEEFKGVI